MVSTTTVSGIGTKYVNFSKGTIDSNAYWVFAGSNTIGSSTTLTNSGTLVDTGTLTNAGSIVGTAKDVSLASNSYLSNQSGGYIGGGAYPVAPDTGMPSGSTT